MNEQRQHATRQQGLLPGLAPGASDPAERLAAARAQLERIYAAADSILDDIRLGDNERFLDQVRQSGGQ